MMLANDLKTYYDEVRRYLDCPKDEQDRLLLSVNKQVIELQVDNPNLDYDGIVEFLGEPESLAASLMERLSPDVVQKFKKKKRRLRLSIIACVAVVVVALSTLTIYTTTRQSNVHNSCLSSHLLRSSFTPGPCYRCFRNAVFCRGFG